MPSVVNNGHLLHNPNPNRVGMVAPPPPPPRRISGILHKWVNCGKGWKPRWFVLQDGVLSYYKIHGSGKIIVAKETDKGCRVIGCSGRFPHHRKPLGELHLKVSSIQESGTDERRFSIFTGTKRLHLKANSREDQIEWMQVLKAVKRMFPQISNTELLNPISISSVTVSTHKLRARLLEEGVNEEIILDAERIMKTEFSEMLNEILIVRKKLRNLIDTLGRL